MPKKKIKKNETDQRKKMEECKSKKMKKKMVSND